MNNHKSRNIEQHIQILTILIATGTLIFSMGLLIGGLVLLPAVLFVPLGERAVQGPIQATILGLGSLAMIFAVANLMLGLSAAFGLYKRRPWGRLLAIIDSGISLMSFPVGTILGAYGLWVLLPDDARAYFDSSKDQDLKAALQ